MYYTLCNNEPEKTHIELNCKQVIHVGSSKSTFNIGLLFQKVNFYNVFNFWHGCYFYSKYLNFILNSNIIIHNCFFFFGRTFYLSSSSLYLLHLALKSWPCFIADFIIASRSCKMSNNFSSSFLYLFIYLQNKNI